MRVGVLGHGNVHREQASPRSRRARRKLLFQRYEANPDLATLGVYLAQSDGTGVRELVRATLWGSSGAPPAWSPTGRTILYGETFGPRYVTRLSTVTADGRHRRTLTSRGGSRLGSGRQPDRLHAHKRHLGHPLARRPATPNRSRVGAGHPSVSGVVARRKAARVQLRQPAVRRPHRRALDETRHAGRHRYVRRLLPSLTAGLVSQRPAPVLLELRITFRRVPEAGAWEGPRPSTRAPPRSSSRLEQDSEGKSGVIAPQ
jgi:hypothetical protein